MSGTEDFDQFLDRMRAAPSSTPAHERKHCNNCGSISISPRGSSIHGQIELPYHCESCNQHVRAREDVLGGEGDA